MGVLKRGIAKVCLLVPLLLLPNCTSYIDCRSEYLYPTYLAAVQVKTPDPTCGCYFGQQVVVSWRISRRFLQKPVNLVFRVRYGDRVIETITVPVERKKDSWVYRLVNKEYWERGGMISFQAMLESEGAILERWDHYLWMDIIEIVPD